MIRTINTKYKSEADRCICWLILLVYIDLSRIYQFRDILNIFFKCFEGQNAEKKMLGGINNYYISTDAYCFSALLSFIVSL